MYRATHIHGYIKNKIYTYILLCTCSHINKAIITKAIIRADLIGGIVGGVAVLIIALVIIAVTLMILYKMVGNRGFLFLFMLQHAWLLPI